MSSGLLDTGFESIEYARNNIQDQALKILREIDEIVIGLNTEKQLFEGINSLGQKLKPSYRNERYKRAKNSVNPLPGLGTPDLKLTGGFYKDFYLIARDDGTFTTFSSNEKADKLKSKYGDSIFGLTKENEEKINLDELLPRLEKWLLKVIRI